jgi:hypothetical protein
MTDKEISVVVRAIDAVTGPIREMNARIKGFADGIAGFFKGLVAGFVALGIADFLKGSIKAASEAQEIWGQLGVAVRNAGGDFGTLGPRIEAAVVSVQRFSSATDEDLKKALTTMITMTGDVKGSLNNLGLAADVAAYKHISVAEAAELVGKAMAGSTKALREFGIEGGTTGERIATLREVVKGFAEEHLNSWPGKLEQVARAWDEVKEAVGRSIISNEELGKSGNRLVDMLTSVEHWVRENETTIGSLVTLLGALGQAVGFVAQVLGMALTSALGIVNALIQSFVGGILEVPLLIKGAFGVVLETIGTVGVAAKGLLKKVGIDVGEGMAEEWRAAGTKMRKEAGTAIGAIDEVVADSWKDIVRTSQEGGDQVAAATKEGHAAILHLTKEQSAALLAMTEDGYSGLSAAQKAALRALEEEHKGHGAAVLRLTGEQSKALDQFRKEDAAKALATAKESHAKLLELEKIAGKAELALLSAQEREYQELERDFRQKMEGMTAEDQAKALQLLDDAHKQQLLKWAGFTDAVMNATGKIAETEQKGIRETTTTFGTLERALNQYNIRMYGTTLATATAAAAQRTLQEHVLDVADSFVVGAQKLSGFLDALGLGSDKTHQLVSGITDIGSAIGQLASGDILGGITSGIKGIKDVVGGLFGKSQAEKELIAGLEKNRQSLEKLDRSIGDLNINLTGKQLAGTKDVLQQFFAQGGAQAKGWGDKLGALLLQKGLTMDDLEAVAKTLQIDIHPSGGHLSPEALRQLQQALGLIEPTTFGTDYRSQRDQLQQETSLFNLSAAEQAKRLAGIGGGQLTGATATAIGGLNFSSAAGLKASLATIQGLFTNLAKIPTAELGGLTPQEFLGLLNDLKGLIDSATQNLGTATETGTTAPPPPETPVPEPGTAPPPAGAEAPAPPGPGGTAPPSPPASASAEPVVAEVSPDLLHALQEEAAHQDAYLAQSLELERRIADAIDQLVVAADACQDLLERSATAVPVEKAEVPRPPASELPEAASSILEQIKQAAQGASAAPAVEAGPELLGALGRLTALIEGARQEPTAEPSAPERATAPITAPLQIAVTVETVLPASATPAVAPAAAVPVPPVPSAEWIAALDRLAGTLKQLIDLLNSEPALAAQPVAPHPERPPIPAPTAPAPSAIEPAVVAPGPVPVTIEQPEPVAVTVTPPTPVQVPVVPPTPVNIPVVAPGPVPVAIEQPEPVAVTVTPPSPVNVPVVAPDLVKVLVEAERAVPPTPVQLPVEPPSPATVPVVLPAPVPEFRVTIPHTDDILAGILEHVGSVDLNVERLVPELLRNGGTLLNALTALTDRAARAAAPASPEQDQAGTKDGAAAAALPALQFTGPLAVIENVSVAPGQDPAAAGAQFAEGLSRELLERISAGLQSLSIDQGRTSGNVVRR